MSINNINSKLDIRPVSQIGESYRWSAVLLILVILILELNTSQASGDDVQRMRPTLLIGYSECRNDLPDGQYANWLTKRSYVVCADGTKRREIGGEIIQDQYSWTQFGGWSPDGSKAVLLSARETPENAAWERKNKTFRMTQGWLMDACLLDLASGQLTNVSASRQTVGNY
jgi:hypothetical protein